MATAGQADFTVTAGAWSELTGTVTGLVDTDCVVQNIGSSDVFVFFGGASAPTTGNGIKLAPLDSVQGNASKIWVQSDGQNGRVSSSTI